MEIFAVKEGRFTPSFEGIHNSMKSKAWLTLLDRRLANREGLTLAELSAAIPGSSYKSLSVLVGRWLRWKYIGYTNTTNGRRYHLLKKGEQWLSRWIEAGVLPLGRYIQELNHE